MIQNKKGSIMYWGVFAILIALLGLGFVVGPELQKDVKASLATSYVQDHVYLLDLSILYQESLASSASQEALFKLASKGGYFREGDCGTYLGQNLLNDGEKTCFPQVLKEYPLEVTSEHLRRNVVAGDDEANYSFILDGLSLVAQEQKPLFSNLENGSFWYSTVDSFRLDLSYNFTDYVILEEESRQLLASCIGNEDLLSCLYDNRKEYWLFSSCISEQYQESEGKVLFCVKSPQNASLYRPSIGQEVPFTYAFALDFASND